MHRMDQLQLKCVHDDLDQASVMPCTRDCQKLFIGKIREDVRQQAHEMLMTRHAHTLINTDLTYANCKFEGLYHQDMMALFSTVETIILQRKASERQNLGTAPAPAYTPKPRGTPTGGRNEQKKDGKRERDGNSWQRRERKYEPTPRWQTKETWPVYRQQSATTRTLPQCSRAKTRCGVLQRLPTRSRSASTATRSTGSTHHVQGGHSAIYLIRQAAQARPLN